MSAGEQTPSKLRQYPRGPSADEQTPLTERRWVGRQWH